MFAMWHDGSIGGLYFNVFLIIFVVVFLVYW